MRVKHKKTGDIYFVVTNCAICTTNAYDGQELVVYRKLNDDQMRTFVRDKTEFWEKFERIE